MLSRVFTLTVSAGANQLAFTTQPGGGAAGAVWSVQPVVAVENSLSQVVTTGQLHLRLPRDRNQPGGRHALLHERHDPARDERLRVLQRLLDHLASAS